MTSELTPPLTILVVAASNAMTAALMKALPKGEAEIVRLADIAETPKPLTEFVDLCLIDATSDDSSGVDLVRRARRRWPTVGICCVGCDDVVAVLAAGADDAVPKGAPSALLAAQVTAAFRRARIACAQLRVAYEDVVYDRESRRVWVAGTEIALTPRELRIFDILFLRAGAPVSLDTLQDYVWKDVSAPTSNALTVYMSYLRRKLRGSQLAFVETMRGIGYRLTRKADEGTD